MEAHTPLKNIPPLISLRAISNGALKADALPTRIKLLNWGTNQSTQGDVIVDESTLAAMSVNQRALGFDRVALDFNHNTVPGSPEFERSKEPRAVAGYGAPEVVRGDGLYLNDITWTPAGQADAKNYADLSPTPALNEQRRVTFLHSAALVRNGAVFDLSFFSANQNPTPEPDMDPKVLADAVALAIKPLNEQLTTLAAEVKAIKEVKPMTFETKVGDKTITLDAGALAAEVIGLKTQLTAQAAAAEEASKGGIIARFAAEGRVPAGEDGKPMDNAALLTLSAPELKRLLANTSATVPLSARGKPAKEGGKDNTLTGIDRAIAAHSHEVAARS